MDENNNKNNVRHLKTATKPIEDVINEDKQMMMAYLDSLKEMIANNKIDALVIVTDGEETIHTETMGTDQIAGVGLLEAGKWILQESMWQLER